MKFTLCFMTGREEPHLDWLLDSLAGHLQRGDEIDLIVVDGLAHLRRVSPIVSERELSILRRVGTFSFLDHQRFELGKPRAHPRPYVSIRVVPPKPTIWQGEHRITKEDWWATANARNTAIVLADTDYMVFCDDRSRLGAWWLAAVRRAERDRASVVAGTYDKLEDGKRTTDHRRGIHPRGLHNCGGGWLYGCTFGCPLDWLLSVNGLEEGCDSVMGEDYILGLMLGNAGQRIDFVSDLYVEQDRSMGTEHAFLSTDKGVSPNDKSHAALARFGKARRTEFTPDLHALRTQRAMIEDAGGHFAFPIPDPNGDYRDWFDNQPIREMQTGILPKDKPK